MVVLMVMFLVWDFAEVRIRFAALLSVGILFRSSVKKCSNSSGDGGDVNPHFTRDSSRILAPEAAKNPLA